MEGVAKLHGIRSFHSCGLVNAGKGVVDNDSIAACLLWDDPGGRKAQGRQGSDQFVREDQPVAGDDHVGKFVSNEGFFAASALMRPPV